ncbi:MAG: type II toxin-antitoxin system VapC family toxin [Planctomycetia bacterium]|nr:type II toxin-antitoxin system VapC family toxin [Planctomycetia bacterium]
MSTTGFPVKVIFDTSIYIPFINDGIAYPAGEPNVNPGKQMLYLSAVVIEELYAGAFDTQSIKLLDTLYKTFKSLNRLLIPDAADWQKTGKVIANIGKKYGFEGIFLSKITNDVLIAVSARRIGARVITNNVKDFSRIKEFVDFTYYEGHV